MRHVRVARVSLVSEETLHSYDVSTCRERKTRSGCTCLLSEETLHSHDVLGQIVRHVQVALVFYLKKRYSPMTSVLPESERHVQAVRSACVDSHLEQLYVVYGIHISYIPGGEIISVHRTCDLELSFRHSSSLSSFKSKRLKNHLFSSVH